jgi:hypothetical protein
LVGHGASPLLKLVASSRIHQTYYFFEAEKLQKEVEFVGEVMFE